METKRERIERLDKYLAAKGITGNQLETKCNLSKGTLSKARSGITDIGMVAINRILEQCKDLSRVWLMTGFGDMLLPESGTVKTKVIRYYPEVEGTAGGVQFLDDPDERWINITVPCATDCTCAINVTGDSMQPLIKSGQIILLSEWTERFIDWGRIYLVVTKSGYRCVKYLYPSKDKKAITCRSEDSMTYPDFDIEHEDIERLFLVRGWICRDAI